jgi:hypothetical protein
MDSSPDKKGWLTLEFSKELGAVSTAASAIFLLLERLD